jgi:16S rRNA U516 pseudouridylate synthase RsuA-like enzyme
VRRLRRIAFGPLVLGSLEPGAWRPLTADEVEGLRKAVPSRSTSSGRGKRRRS